jgi:hypothetical protein
MAGLNGHTRNGHVKPAGANGADRPPLEPFADGTAEGRDAGGRFARGNKGGPGNPHARRVAALRSALLEALTPERMRTLAERLYDRALGGDTAAAKLLLAYALGRPAQPVNPDRLDLDEWGLRMDSPRFGDVVEAAGKLLVDKAFVMLGELEPGASLHAGATIVPLANLLGAAVQPAAGPAGKGHADG